MNEARGQECGEIEINLVWTKGGKIASISIYYPTNLSRHAD